jgi:hypothetical protein
LFTSISIRLKFDHGLPHQFAAVAGVRNVVRNDKTLTAGIFDQFPRLRGVLVLIEIGD